ncbi:SUKH-4 family immunity protein [Streptomyces sp. NPDC053427]|uniref:SUKH-4 family immunity protein n=1 Tax=Streptomyces sp. NPDC053427 TaxID=3365701 RepID=UPI0037D654DB
MAEDSGQNQNQSQSQIGDVTVDEIRRIWGDRLRPVPSDLVSPRLSTPTREFLTTVGLPTVQVRDIVPLHDERLLDSTSQLGHEYVAVAEGDEPGYLFAVEVATDRVFYLDDIPQYNRLINSNIALFVLFLGIFQTRVLDLDVVTQETLEDAVADVWRQLCARDHTVTTDDRNWWGAMLDQIAAEC